jgi:cytochrome P450
MTIFLAGHETTAQWLTWTWYLLSKNPGAEVRLHAELDAVLGGRPPSPADAQRLPYTEMVLSEALRMYPPAYVLGRRALQDHRMGGYLVPAGSIVLLSQWVMHHDPRWFPEPFRFDPGRWTGHEQATRPRHAFFPFGGGPRVCIGEGFAWMESKLVLATLASTWRARLDPSHGVELRPVVTLRPKGGMPMTLERRRA